MKIKFNPENKEKLTYGECLDSIAKITNKKEAKQYLNDYVDWLCKFHNLNEKKARQTALHNIGYYAGYFSQETMKKIYELFETHHPILPI